MTQSVPHENPGIVAEEIPVWHQLGTASALHALSVETASGLSAAAHAYVIGATVVAIGTSLPELVTTLLARWRGHYDVGLAIVGAAAAIHPTRAPLGEVVVALGFGVLTVLLMLPRGGSISRRRGLVLLAVYAAFVSNADLLRKRNHEDDRNPYGPLARAKRR